MVFLIVSVEEIQHCRPTWSAVLAFHLGGWRVVAIFALIRYDNFWGYLYLKATKSHNTVDIAIDFANKTRNV